MWMSFLLCHSPFLFLSLSIFSPFLYLLISLFCLFVVFPRRGQMSTSFPPSFCFCVRVFILPFLCHFVFPSQTSFLLCICLSRSSLFSLFLCSVPFHLHFSLSFAVSYSLPFSHFLFFFLSFSSLFPSLSLLCFFPSLFRFLSRQVSSFFPSAFLSLPHSFCLSPRALLQAIDRDVLLAHADNCLKGMLLPQGVVGFFSVLFPRGCFRPGPSDIGMVWSFLTV